MEILKDKGKDPLSKDKDTLLKNKLPKYCIAAVKYSTIGGVYKNVLEFKKKIYLVTSTDGKTTAYGSCSKTAHEGELCHLHQQMLSRETLKIFDKDIVPIPGDKSNLKRLADINDPYFENMGKRGAKEKNSNNIYTFSNKEDPILKILNHKNQKLSTLLHTYASHLLKGNPNSPMKDNNLTINTSSNLLSLMSSVIDKEENISDTEVSESDISEMSNKSEGKKSSDGDEVESDDSDDESQSSVSCIELTANNGKTLYFNEIDNMVYELSGELIGILTEISEDFHTITYNDKYYTVLEEQNKVFCCKITGTLFDKNLNFVSVSKKTGKNKVKSSK